MSGSTLLGDWSKSYAGSTLDLSGFHLNFDDNFNSVSVGTSGASAESANWFAPVRPTFGSATFVGPDSATSPFSAADGALTISMQQVNGAWQTGYMQTLNSGGQGFAQQYGYFEMSAKFPAGAGSWPAFWLLSTDPTKPRVEIDIVEAYGNDDVNGHHATVHFTPQGDSTLSQKVVNSDYTDVPGSMFDGNFHTYGAMVTPEWIIIYYDRVEITRFASNEYIGTPMYMVVDLAMYPGEVTEAAGKYDMVVDYVRAWADPNITGLLLDGGAAGDTLTGARMNDTLDGGAAADTMSGAAGDDTYHVDDAGDLVIEAAGGGRDQVLSSVSYTAPADQEIEIVRLTGPSSIDATGNGLANALYGNAVANVLDGGEGADTLSGGWGNDTYYVDNVGDVIFESSDHDVDQVYSSVSYSLSGSVEKKIENLTLTGTADINAYGNGLKNVLVGNGGANVLNGAASDDTMIGGAGDDTYYVADGADKVVEAANGGTDTVILSRLLSNSFANVENITLAGGANLVAIGNALANVLTGNAGANQLDGREGGDSLAGGGGADTLIGGSGRDVFLFDAAPGTGNVDLIKDFNVADDTIWLDNLVFTGLDVGNLASAAFQVGAAAADAFDRLIYDRATGALFYDSDGTGAATQIKIAQLTAGLSMTAADFFVTGEAHAEAESTNLVADAGGDSLSGGPLNDTLQGGPGDDTLAGGGGNDTYYVNSAGDRVVEVAGEGQDQVYASVDFSAAGQDIEIVRLSGTATRATGNELANQLLGNAEANILDGGAGADTMNGGWGADTYYVDNVRDVVVENSDNDVDLVYSTVSYSLSGSGDNKAENLTLTGTADVNAYGNSLKNVLVGNAGNNVLNGAAADDTMIGGAGDDTYYVADGADKVVEEANGGTDTVILSRLFSGSFANVENTTLTGWSDLVAIGNALDNRLVGNSGANALDGREGADTLQGGSGADTMTGGTGRDVFMFDAAPSDTAVDQIRDYNLADDVIHLDNAVFTGLADGPLAASAFSLGSAAADGASRIIYDQSTGFLYYDADGSGAGAQIKVAQLTAGLAMTAAEFVVI